MKNFSNWPQYSKKEIKSVSKVLASGKVNYWTGINNKIFEKKFAKITDTKYAIALANGTLALDLALFALGIGVNDEVIVTPRTFIASVSSIVLRGAKPIFVDIDPSSQNIDFNKIKKKITKKTKAIICVHLAGWPCDMKEIIKIAKKFKLKIIEDCAQAHGARYMGKSVGSLGDIGCWSFCQDKIISTGGEGGMITTNKYNLWKKMFSYKDHGKNYNVMINKSKSTYYTWPHHSFGSNYRMTEIQAILGIIQISNLNKINSIRKRNANEIWNSLKDLPYVKIPSLKCLSCPGKCDRINGCNFAAYKTYIFLDIPFKKKIEIKLELLDKGIPCFDGVCPEVYREKAFLKYNFKPEQKLNIARYIGEKSLMFLCDQTIQYQKIKKASQIIRETIINKIENKSAR